MKKGILLIAISLWSTLLFTQNFSFEASPNPSTGIPLFLNVEPDTLKTTITNLSTNTADLILAWEVQDIQIPAGWQVSICDFNDCHDPGILNSPASINLAFQASKSFGVLFLDQGISGIGTVTLKIMSLNTDDLFQIVTFSFLNFNNANVQTIEGNISYQDNNTCNYDETNPDLSNWIIKADGDNDFYGYTDSLGNYWMYVFTGEYQLSAIPPNDNWAICNNDIPLSMSFFYPDTVVNFVAEKAYECPLLHVDISTPILRRCFDNRYFINYCNEGSALATNPYVEIFFDEHFTITNSSIPISNQVANLYRFDLEDLEIDTCGSFYVDVNLDCNSSVLGQTHCVEAHIYPDSICTPISDAWSGAEIEVSASCEGDSIRFKIQNIGSAASAKDLKYKIIEDHVILYQGKFDLAPGDSLIEVYETNGKTFRLEAQQEPFYPIKSAPAVSVELCGDDSNASLGQINLFSLDDEAKFKSIDCQDNIGSLAEDGKIGFPIGYGDERWIPENSVLEYMIHFQNIGTDTAFSVVILDTISEFLDIESIERGAASHPYNLQLLGSNLIRISFPGIQLPDKSTDELASHGFVKFKLKLHPTSNALAFHVINQAQVFFDYTQRVITSTVIHKVGESPVSIFAPSNTTIPLKFYPNPMAEYAILEWTKNPTKESIFKLYDLQGRLQRETRFRGNSYLFQRKELIAGMYIYQIEQAGILLGAGKLVIR